MIGVAGYWRGRLGIYRATEDSQSRRLRAIFNWSIVIGKWAAISLAVFIVLNVLVYLLFSKIAMPFTKVHGLNVGFSSYASIETKINQHLRGQSIPVTVNKERFAPTYKELGLSFSSEESFKHRSSVSGLWGLPVIQLVMNSLTPTSPYYNVDRQQLEATMSSYITSVDQPAIDATIAFPDALGGEFSITESHYGRYLDESVAADQLVDSVMGSSTISIKPEFIAPAVAEADLDEALVTAQEAVTSPITVTNESGKTITKIRPETFLHLMTVDGDSISVKKKKLARYIHEELAMYYYVPTEAKRINGGVVAAQGKNGKTIDEQAAFERLSIAITNPDVNEVAIGSKVIKAPEVVDGIYPQTDAGLATLLQDFDASKGGDYRFVVSQMKDDGLFAHHNGVQSIIPASTYKAFIAYAALKSIERGEYTLDSMTNHGTIEACIHEMIHVSTDHCAIAIQDLLGWQRIDDILHEAGFVDTNINNEGWGSEKWTTSLDEYRLMRGLYDGSLLNQAHTEHLLNEMKNQMWRSGLPAGSAPAVVADKVGFYAGRENDVGIIYADKGDYIIVAMSHGGSFGEIAQMARQVYEFFGN